jgi:ribosomal protein L7/L12
VQLVVHKRFRCSVQSVSTDIGKTGINVEIQRMREKIAALTKAENLAQTNFTNAKDLVEKLSASNVQLKKENAELRQTMRTMHDTLARSLNLDCQKKSIESEK